MFEILINILLGILFILICLAFGIVVSALIWDDMGIRVFDQKFWKHAPWHKDKSKG